MTVIKALLLLAHFTLCPVAVGRLITYRVKEPTHKSPTVTYVVGLFATYGIFFLLCSALTWFQYWETYNVPFTGCFTALTYAYSVLLAILVIVWLIKDRQAIARIPAFLKERVGGDIVGQTRKNIFTIGYALIFALLLLAQVYFAYGYEVNEWSYDDYDYVANSQDTISSDTLSYVNYITGEMPFTASKRAATSWPTYIAYLARVSGFEVTTVCHTILPVIFLFIAYGVYYYMSGLLFKEMDNRLIFMDLLSVAFIFGDYSHYSMTFRLLCTIWQGKAILSAIAVPFLIVYLAYIYKEDFDAKNILPIVAFSLGVASLTTMSMLMLSLTALLMWLIMGIYKRKPASFRYLLASMAGPLFQIFFYNMINLLFKDMLGYVRVFKRGRDISWWYKWFG